jgi:hypothetical protein
MNMFLSQDIYNNKQFVLNVYFFLEKRIHTAEGEKWTE